MNRKHLSDRQFQDRRSSVDKPKLLQTKVVNDFQNAQKNLPNASNGFYDEDEDFVHKPTITTQEFEDQVWSRFEAWNSARKSKIGKMKKELLEDYGRNNRHQPEINKSSRNMRSRTPLVERVQFILDDQNQNYN